MSHSSHSLDITQIQTYTESLGIRLPSFFITTSVQDEFVSYLQGLARSVEPTRSRCLVSIQEHWIAIDIEKKEPGAPLSIIVLDAANNIYKIGCIIPAFDFILKDHSAYELFHFCSTYPLQRDGQRCLIFAIEHSQWAHQNPHLHTEVKAIATQGDSLANSYIYEPKIREILSKRGTLTRFIDKIISDLQKPHIFLIDYERIYEALYNWQDFFINSQADALPTVYAELIDPWLIERGEVGAPRKRHNIHIDYCEHQIRARIASTEPLSVAEFMKQEILKSFQMSEEKSGLLLPLAIASRKIHTIKALLRFNLVDVNHRETGKTALDRAYRLPDGPERTFIIDLLIKHGAQRSETLATQSIFAASAMSTVETTMAGTPQGKS